MEEEEDGMEEEEDGMEEGGDGRSKFEEVGMMTTRTISRGNICLRPSVNP